MRHLFLTLTLMAPILFAPAVSIPAAAETVGGGTSGADRRANRPAMELVSHF